MIFVTGATGFVGASLSARLASGEAGPFRLASRRPIDPRLCSDVFTIGDSLDSVDWRGALAGVDSIVHLAARVHVMDERAADPLAAFRAANVTATLSLARAAIDAGVRRFVFASSLKVLGESTAAGVPMRPDDVPRPMDPYGRSKCEAEQGLRALAAQGALEVVIVRPPLVYGPGVRANFRSMMRWLGRGWPLPLGAVDNRRSLVSLDNLVDLLLLCLRHPMAANSTLHASDGHDVSTTELLRSLGAALGRPARLVPVPPALLRGAAALVGAGPQAARLLGNLQSDITLTRERLGWSPPQSFTDGIAQTARAFLHETHV